MLHHVVECVDQAECATLALDEGDAPEHAHVQSDWEAARVCASSTMCTLPRGPPVRQAPFALRIQAHLKYLLHPTGLLLAAASPEEGMLQVTVGYPSTSATASPCVLPGAVAGISRDGSHQKAPSPFLHA